MNRNPSIAEHATAFEGIVATFTKIDKAKGSTGTRAAGTVTGEQETPLCMNGNVIECRGIVALRYSWSSSFVSTVFRLECNSAIRNMTKWKIFNSRCVALMFQLSSAVRAVSHA
jgi:hypothetical protein